VTIPGVWPAIRKLALGPGPRRQLRPGIAADQALPKSELPFRLAGYSSGVAVSRFSTSRPRGCVAGPRAAGDSSADVRVGGSPEVPNPGPRGTGAFRLLPSNFRLPISWRADQALPEAGVHS